MRYQDFKKWRTEEGPNECLVGIGDLVKAYVEHLSMSKLERWWCGMSDFEYKRVEECLRTALNSLSIGFKNP